MGKRYFEGVYEQNNPAHVLENAQSQGEPLNYYAFRDKQRMTDRAKVKVATGGSPGKKTPEISEG